MKIVCEVCRNLGQLQHLSKNYYRVKHYLGSVDGKLKFEYHKQSPKYISEILAKRQDIDPIDLNNIDLKLNNSSSFTENTRAGSLARLGHPLDVRKVAGSNPARPTKTSTHSLECLFELVRFSLNLPFFCFFLNLRLV